MEHKKLPTLSELKAMRKPLYNVALKRKDNLRPVERFAVWVTEHIGTMGFFFILTVWTFGWLFWNTVGPLALRFDPYPAFVLWLFISNMIQLLFLPLIMVGQNLEGRYAEARDEADFEINIKAEREIETILLHLENQNNLMLKILARLENHGK